MLQGSNDAGSASVCRWNMLEHRAETNRKMLKIGLQQSLYGPCRKMKTSYSRRDVPIAIVIDRTVNEDEPRICQEKREVCKGSKRRQVGL